VFIDPSDDAIHIQTKHELYVNHLHPKSK